MRKYTPGVDAGVPVRSAHIYTAQIFEDHHHLLSRGAEFVGSQEIRLHEADGRSEVDGRRRLLLGVVKQRGIGALKYHVGGADGLAERPRAVPHGVVEVAAVAGELLVQVGVRRRQVDDVLEGAVVGGRKRGNHHGPVHAVGRGRRQAGELAALVDGQDQAPALHAHQVGPVEARGRASGGFAEAKALGATVLVRRLDVEGALAAHVARQALHVRLAEALGGVLVADVAGGAAQVAVAALAVRELRVAGPAAVALTTHRVLPAAAAAVEQIALQITVQNAQGRAAALLAADDRMEAVSAGLALVASRARHSGRADALAAVGLAQSGRRTVARPAPGEAVEAGPAGLAAPADYVRPAGALAAEFLALETGGAVDDAAARQRAVVVVGRQREAGVAAEAVLGDVDVEVVVAAALDELLGLIEAQLTEDLFVVLIRRYHQHVVQPDAAIVGGLLQRQHEVLDQLERGAAAVHLANDAAAAAVAGTMRHRDLRLVELAVLHQHLQHELWIIRLIVVHHEHVVSGLRHFGGYVRVAAAAQVDQPSGVVVDAGRSMLGLGHAGRFKLDLLSVGLGEKSRHTFAVFPHADGLGLHVVQRPLVQRDCHYRADADL